MVASRREAFGEVERLHLSRTLAGRPLYWASVYRIGDVLVDSGPSSARPAFVRWIAERPVGTVLTTHEHEDHIGNHAALPRCARVLAPELARRFLEEGHPPFPFYRRFVWGYHESAPGALPLPARVEAGGRAFRVVRTNGHSADHVAFLDERENGLFCGDAYMGKFKAARLEEDVIEEIATLRRMADLDPATLYPAHGPVIPRPRARLIETAEHFESLWRDVWRLRERGRSPRRIARELFPREPLITRYSFGEFSCANMVVNLLRAPPAPEGAGGTTTRGAAALRAS